MCVLPFKVLSFSHSGFDTDIKICQIFTYFASKCECERTLMTTNNRRSYTHMARHFHSSEVQLNNRSKLNNRSTFTQNNALKLRNFSFTIYTHYIPIFYDVFFFSLNKKCVCFYWERNILVSFPLWTGTFIVWTFIRVLFNVVKL